MKKLNITKEQFEKSNYFKNKYGNLEYVSESGKVFKTNKGKMLMFKEDSQGLRSDEKKKWTWWGSSDDATYNDAPSSDYEQGDIDWCPEGGWEDREDAWYSMLAVVTDIISQETTGVDLRNDVYDDVKQGHRSAELDIDHDAGTVEANINGDHYEWWLAEER